MVKERAGSLVWLRKRIEDADADLLREMVKAMTEAFMSAEASAVCGAPYRLVLQGHLACDRLLLFHR